MGNSGYCRSLGSAFPCAERMALNEVEEHEIWVVGLYRRVKYDTTLSMPNADPDGP